jgi:uncharacterized delta-60 repeat protein
MPYIIDSITAETINVNLELLVDGQEVPMPSYINNGDSSVNTNIDWSNGVIQELNLDNDPTLTLSNGLLGQTSTLLLKQQLSGLRFITWPNDVIWNGGNPVELQTLAGAGSIDDSFNVGTGLNERVNDVKIQSDGKILVGGLFTSYNGTTSNYFIRLNSDGSIDNSFSMGTGFSQYVQSITVQSDGKILVVGGFTSYNGTSSNRIARLNSNGSIDNSFNIGSGFTGNNFPYVMAVQSDGKIVIGGEFISYNGVSFNNILRLNSDGSIDNSFDIGTGITDEVFSFVNDIKIQSDGKILVVGYFTSYNGTPRNRIIRLNPDGSIDNSFDIGTGFPGDDYPYVIEIQPDGKIFVGGFFTSYNGTSVNNIIRLNSDGGIDNSFDIGPGPNNSVNDVKIQSDGKILVGGYFTSYNGTSRNRIIRLNSDGSIDNSFNIGTGFNQYVESILIQQDGKILVGGFFTSFNEASRNRIVRLEGLPPLAYNKVEFDYNGIYYIGSY